MKRKIGFLFLCVICLTLAGCFHIPDEDWIFTKDSSKNDIGISNEESEFINSMNVLLDEFQKDNSNEHNSELSGHKNENEIQIQNSESDLKKIDAPDATGETPNNTLVE